MSETVSVEKACTSCGTPFIATMTKLLGRFPIPVSVFKESPERCAACSEEFQQQVEAKYLRRLLNFTPDQVKEHFTANPPTRGDTLILVMQQHHQNWYRLVRVENPDHTRQHRIVIDKGCCFGGASYYRTGQSTFAPTGQTFLRPFVPAIAKRLSYVQEIELTDDDLLAQLGE